jgi:hypothetical protein
MMESIMFKAIFVVIGLFLVLIIEKIFRPQSKWDSHIKKQL